MWDLLSVVFDAIQTVATHTLTQVSSYTQCEGILTCAKWCSACIVVYSFVLSSSPSVKIQVKSFCLDLREVRAPRYSCRV